MEPDTLIDCLDDPAAIQPRLRALKLKNVDRAHHNLVSIAQSGVTLDLLATLSQQLSRDLPRLSDPDMALNNLDRFFAASRSPLALAALFERDPEALPTLLQIFSSSQHLSDLLIREPETFDLLRLTDGQPVAREVLTGEICNDVANADGDREIMAVLRRHKQRETLRIAYGDIVKRQRVETVTEQISLLADAICEAALQAAWRKTVERRGQPRRVDGQRSRFVVLALGKLGGLELNYSSDIDLIFLSDDGGHTDGSRPVTNAEFFERLARQVFQYLNENTTDGVAYRVDLRLRPSGSQGPSVIGISAALSYYDVSGRTWERQAFVKARAIAGDLDLGTEFLQLMEPWIYRRYLSSADIIGMRALKRRIEQRCLSEGGDQRDVKQGRGGIRDIEFVIQFLQLLNGGDLPEIRTGNTLQAIARLEEAGCLTSEERTVLEQNYQLLRKLEHRLQIMFDLQTHMLPDSDEELRKLAIRMGYAEGPYRSPLDSFRADYQQKTERNRWILKHLMGAAEGFDDQAEPEVDLVLDPAPSDEQIEQVLGCYGFKNLRDAYTHLTALTTERISILSTRRCRHFLAAIAPQLLQEISETPDPDSTLINLSQVSDSLGGKGVLWELFRLNAPSMQLYVRLCAATPYLSSILTSNPGMIDELLDSLVLDKLPSFETLERMLEDLLHGAEDAEPILHGFKNSLHLRVGVRDILGKADIRETQRVLSDISEVCLKQIAASEFQRLAARYGTPMIQGGPKDGQPCELIILAMGKLGGREPNYHSDLDVVFLYEADGVTRHPRGYRNDQSTTNQHFFSQLGQRIIKVINHLGPHGRLYELDPRLRPTGRSGSLAVSLDEFARYFATGQGQLWERQALCKSRVIFGSDAARQAAMQVVTQSLIGRGWQPNDAVEIRRMRWRLEETATRTNLKRGPGGTVDIEFAVQMLQMKHGADRPEVLVPGTLDAIEALSKAGAWDQEDAEYLVQSYRFLRSVEARLRLMNTTARHDLPEDESERRKLAFLLGYDDADALLEDCRNFTAENRRRCDRLFDDASMGEAGAG
jgi:[glutamine synthetase] adenylyltransferase / [glutamine synthetase]-adenylyl-L-tyrosine phosphorylase